MGKTSRRIPCAKIDGGAEKDARKRGYASAEHSHEGCENRHFLCSNVVGGANSNGTCANARVWLLFSACVVIELYLCSYAHLCIWNTLVWRRAYLLVANGRGSLAIGYTVNVMVGVVVAFRIRGFFETGNFWMESTHRRIRQLLRRLYLPVG